MTKSVPTNQINRRDFLKKLTANTAKVALGAAALSAVSAIPQAAASAASLAVKHYTQTFKVNVNSTTIWDG